MDTTPELLDDVEEELMARSFLFTHPISYRDGVAAATQAVRAMAGIPSSKPHAGDPGKEAQ